MNRIAALAPWEGAPWKLPGQAARALLRGSAVLLVRLVVWESPYTGLRYARWDLVLRGISDIDARLATVGIGELVEDAP